MRALPMLLLLATASFAQPRWLISEPTQFANRISDSALELTSGAQVEPTDAPGRAAADRWEKGTPLLLSYASEIGAALVDPATNTWIAIRVSGDQHPIDIQLQKCLNSPQSYSTQAIADCNDRAGELWAGEIQRLFARMLAALPRAQRPLLEASQTTWQRYFDAEIKARAEIHNAAEFGTIALIENATAACDMKRERATELERLSTGR